MTPLCTLTRTDGQRPFGNKQTGASQEISVRGGLHGALISGVVQSDENPLYSDDNSNGVADEFEAALVKAGGSTQEPALMAEWRQYAFAIILTPEQATALRGELVKRFGCSCIGRNPASIMQAILAKGKISNDQEVELVRDRLADQIRPSFGSDEYLTFSRIMAEYETRHK